MLDSLLLFCLRFIKSVPSRSQLCELNANKTPMKKLIFLCAVAAISLGTSAFTIQQVADNAVHETTVQSIQFTIFNDSGADLELFIKRGDMEKHASVGKNQGLSLKHVPGAKCYIGQDATGTLLFEVKDDFAGKGFMVSKLLAAQESTEK